MPNPWRSGEKGVRPPRIANCSGYHGDDPEEMLKQATKGDVDFITGDYLAEVNMADNAEAHARGDHPGYEQTAWMGIQQSISVINENKIKIAINGGALSPEGLARKVAELVKSKGYDLKVAYVSGDNVLSKVFKTMPGSEDECLPHLDSDNKHVCPSRETYLFTRMQNRPEIVSANAYTGARAIVKALEEGADIIICGRVSDASPVIAAAWYWWGWSASDYDALAGALVAGHLIECSAYVTGGNFAGFDRYSIKHFVDPGFPIAEIAKDGSCVITKHQNTGGMVNIDTCKSQLLYELQGNIYLNSDVKAYLDDIEIEEIGKDRVQVRGARGAPPPPTTKLAIFYKGGYEMQILMNATGYAFERKFELLKRQIEHFVGKENLDKLDVFDLQCLGTPATDPRNQNESTVYFRVFAQAGDIAALSLLGKSFLKISLKHFHGYHSSLGGRTAIPRPYLAYYPALWPQSEIDETVHFVNRDGSLLSIPCASLSKSEPLEQRTSYDTSDPVEFTGPFRKVRLGDVALARSGDKGANLNFGIYVDRKEKWDWLRTYLSRARVSSMLEADMQPDYTIERVEFPKLYAVHFVVYGILGRGVSSSKRLDGFGKGFADYFRDKLVDYPESLVALEHQPQPSL